MTNIFRVKKLTHLLSSQCQLRPGRETENWQVSADLTCHPQLLWRTEDNKFVSAMCLHVNECQCPLATIECRQCVDIVVLTDDNVPMLDNQCYTPIISRVPVSRPAQPAVSPRLHTFAALIWGDTRTPSEDAEWQRPISSPLIDTKNYADKVLYSRGQIQMQTRTRVSIVHPVLRSAQMGLVLSFIGAGMFNVVWRAFWLLAEHCQLAAAETH